MSKKSKAHKSPAAKAGVPGPLVYKAERGGLYILVETIKGTTVWMFFSKKSGDRIAQFWAAQDRLYVAAHEPIKTRSWGQAVAIVVDYERTGEVIVHKSLAPENRSGKT